MTSPNKSIILEIPFTQITRLKSKNRKKEKSILYYY